MTYQPTIQRGQTLIETVVAVFILVMGITAALGLANYSLNATSSIRKQIIAMGLAREGIEAIKSMRDTNWLNAPLSSSCYDYYSSSNVSFCYPNWMNPAAVGQSGYNINPGATYGTAYPFALSYDVNAAPTAFWSLSYRPSNNNYGLNYDASANPQHGLYSSWTPTTVAAATSDFARKVSLTLENGVPFNDPGSTGLGPRIKVTSQVWWKDKKCPVSEDVPASKSCVITLETYLTNWKDF